MKKSLEPVKKEISNLLEMFEFFLTERQLGRPVDKLGDCVRDLRIILGRLLLDHFMEIPKKTDREFCSNLATMLAERAGTLPTEKADGVQYIKYCISEIIACFELASEIKTQYKNDAVFQKILALDIPILRPFDYGLRAKLSVVKGKKKKVMHRVGG